MSTPDKTPDLASTQLIQVRTRRDRHRTSVIGLLRAIGLNGVVTEQFVSLTPEDDSEQESARGNAANFESVEVLSSSPHGTVLRALDRNIARTVAMKVLLSPTDVPEEKVVRFVHEAQLTGQLEHPNIVPVHEIGVDSRGNVYYVMKYIKGITLQRVIDRLHRGDPAMLAAYPLPRLLEILAKVCDAIAFAHSRGVIHRDLKPENIMLGDFGEVLVMDWGLGKLVEKAEGETAAESETDGDDLDEARLATIRNLAGKGDVFATLAGVVMGTPAYMAPEQARRSAPVSFPADIYALGGILYGILALRPPIEADRIDDIIKAKLRGEIRPPGAIRGPLPLRHCPQGRVPEALAAVSMRALALAPADRYATVQEFRAELDRYSHGHATDAERASAVKLIFLLAKRHKERLAVLAAAFVVIGMIGCISVREVLQANREANDALLRAAGIGDVEANRRLGVASPALEARLAAARTAAAQIATLNPLAAPLHWHCQLVGEGLEIDLSNNPHLRDISPLRNLPITSLYLANTAVTDLTPLKNLPLVTLVLSGSPIDSVEILQHAPLRTLGLQHCGLRSLTGIALLPLVDLDLRGNAGLSVESLQDHPLLRTIALPADCDPAPLRTVPNLQMIGYQLPLTKASEFWAKHPAAPGKP